MKRLSRRLTLALSLGVLVSAIALPAHTSAAPARSHTADDANTLTILTCCGMWAGFNNPNFQGYGLIPYARYFKTLWKQRFPNLTIHEIDATSFSDLVAKTILGVNSGNPPDLVGVQGQLGLLVARHAVQNLDKFYAAAHITPSYFLLGMGDWARINNHWYAMPAAGGLGGNVFYIPQFVKAAGLDPNHVPITWNQLWQATQKATKWDSKGNLVRIGVKVDGYSSGNINLFCGYLAYFNPSTNKFNANLPCIKDYFRYEKRLLDFYGGVTKYNKFAAADPDIWNGYTPKAYVADGQVLFTLTGYWEGQILDQHWNLDWRLGVPITQHGTLAEWRAVTSTGQMNVIPVGAKHAQLAWDFAKFTLFDHDYLQGPTTNTFNVAAHAQKWAQVMLQNSAQVREKNHFPGNPMALALPVVMKMAKYAAAHPSTDVASPYYDDYMNEAWQEIEYNKMSVDQALDRAQQLIDTKQHALHAQFGM